MNPAYPDDSERLSWWQLIKQCSGTAADRRNQYRFLAWTLLWAIAFLAATWVLRSDFGLAQPLAFAVALIPTGFGIGAVFAYLRFLRMADELVRQIQLQGIAFAFGVSFIFAMGYQLFEHAGAPVMSVSDFVLVMSVGWIVGQLLAIGRYR